MLFKVRVLLKLLRIQQWVKNGFIFIPAFFGGNILEPHLLIKLFVGFISFSLLASVVYILNDYIDIEKDRLHPKKRYRPLASGEISKKEAKGLAIIVLSFSSIIVFLFANHFNFILILIIYFVLNILYSLKLKKFSIIDIVIIAIGFLLRIWSGGVLGEVVLSKWIIIMTFLLALFLALAKRRDDVLLLNQNGVSARESIKGYNMEFINLSMTLMAAVIIVSYIMYTVSLEVMQRSSNDLNYITTIWVVIGVLRYLQLSIVEQNSGDPTQLLLKDKFLFTVIILWSLTNIWIVYFL